MFGVRQFHRARLYSQSRGKQLPQSCSCNDESLAIAFKMKPIRPLPLVLAQPAGEGIECSRLDVQARHNDLNRVVCQTGRLIRRQQLTCGRRLQTRVETIHHSMEFLHSCFGSLKQRRTGF